MTIQRIATVCVALLIATTLIGCATTDGMFSVPADAKVKPQSVKDGFAVFLHEGVTWVFDVESEEVQKFMAGEELAKHVTRLANVNGTIQKIKSSDMETINSYLALTKSAKSSPATPQANSPTAKAAGDENLTIAAKLAHDVQTGVATAKAGTHADIKPSTPAVAQLAKATPVASKSLTSTAIRSGFVIFELEEATWVFATNSQELAKFQAGEELAKHSTKLKGTPGGVMKVKSDDQATINAYLAAKSGFVTRVIDGYLWVFYEGSSEHKAIDAGEELAKHVTKLTNVNGTVRTIKAPSTEVLDAYNAATPGIATRIVGGYLWVFAPKGETLALVDAGGEPAKHVTKLLSINNQVRTVRAGDLAVINAYHAAKPGFETMSIDGYTWVFVQGSSEFKTVLNGGELAKHVTKMKAIDGKVQTFKAPDVETLAAYLR